MAEMDDPFRVVVLDIHLVTRFNDTVDREEVVSPLTVADRTTLVGTTRSIVESCYRLLNARSAEDSKKTLTANADDCSVAGILRSAATTIHP